MRPDHEPARVARRGDVRRNRRQGERTNRAIGSTGMFGDPEAVAIRDQGRDHDERDRRDQADDAAAFAQRLPSPTAGRARRASHRPPARRRAARRRPRRRRTRSSRRSSSTPMPMTTAIAMARGASVDVGDQRRAGLRVRDDVVDADDRAQRPMRTATARTAEDARRRRQPREQPDAARRAVPQLGEEVGQGEEHERQRRVVVVLERRPVDPGPREPLHGERDRDERERGAPALERLPGDEGHGRHGQPPGDEVARVVDRGRGAAGEALLVEPDRLQVEGPRPPRRRGRDAPSTGCCGSRTSPG